MTNIQNIEIGLYHDKIAKDVRDVIEKYREIMVRDVPDNDPIEADRLIFKAMHTALLEIEQAQK